MSLPKDEIKNRLNKLSLLLKEHKYDAALVRYPLSIFYLSGTFVDGHLIVTAAGEAYLLVYRCYERAKEEALIDEVHPFRSLKALPAFLRDLGLKTIALEEDRLPQNIYRNYQRLLSGFELVDLGPLLREARMIKSPYEISCLERAGQMLAEALEAFWPQVRVGLSELELAGRLEAELRRLGHPAYTRTYAFHQELAYGHLLSGPSASYPSYLTTGQGGPGVLGFAQGPSARKIKENEPILVDYAGWFAGYMVDQSRLFVVGSLPQRLSHLYEKVLQLMESLEGLLMPGVLAEEIYQRAFSLAEELGIVDYLMAHGQEKVPFLGHGVGLEIDEWPPLAPKVKVPLEEGMVLALEPKLHLSGEGVIGLEDTFVITSNGPKRLTLYPREIVTIEPHP